MKILTKLLRWLNPPRPRRKRKKPKPQYVNPCRPRTIEDIIHYKIMEKLDDRHVLASVYRKSDPKNRVFIIRKDNGELFPLKFPNRVIDDALKFRKYKPVMDIINTLDQSIL